MMANRKLRKSKAVVVPASHAPTRPPGTAPAVPIGIATASPPALGPGITRRAANPAAIAKMIHTRNPITRSSMNLKLVTQSHASARTSRRPIQADHARPPLDQMIRVAAAVSRTWRPVIRLVTCRNSSMELAKTCRRNSCTRMAPLGVVATEVRRTKKPIRQDTPRGAAASVYCTTSPLACARLPFI
jgi:hypothetical protein